MVVESIVDRKRQDMATDHLWCSESEEEEEEEEPPVDVPPDELDEYLKHDTERLYAGVPWSLRIGRCDPFLFWLIHKDKYPTLFLMAMRSLATPAASSYSERIFSGSGIASGGRRSCLSPRLLEAMMIVKYNLLMLLDTNKVAQRAHK